MKCTKCKLEKSLTEFYKRKPPYTYPSDEYHSWCKDCSKKRRKKEYYANRKERLKQYKVNFNKNREHNLMVKRKYYC